MNQRRSSDRSDSKSPLRTWRWSSVVVILAICAIPLAADDPPEDRPQPVSIALPEQPDTAPDSNPNPLTPPDEQNQPALPLWQLDVGQIFRTSSSVERQTEFHVSDDVNESTQTDRQTFQYRVTANDPRGGVQLRIQIESLDRESTTSDGNKSIQKTLPQQILDATEVDLRIRNGGGQIDTAGLQSLIRSRQPETREVFSRLIGPRVFQSWVDLPFRIPLITQMRPQSDIRIQPRRGTAPAAPAAQLKPPAADEATLFTGYTWNRMHSLSLGLLGLVDIDCQYTVDSIDDSAANITVTGTATAMPALPPSRSAWNIVSVKMADSRLQGSGRVVMNRDLQFPSTIDFEQKLTLQGSGVLRSGDETHKFRFKQLLTQKWNVSEFGYYDTPQGVPLQPKRPIP